MFPSGQLSRVLVPLCGKSLDLRYLWERGHDVTGIDGVAAVVPAFVQESGVQLLPVPHDQQRHRTSDARLSILTADFFHLSPIHTFPCVWDRAALYALSPDLRRRYVETIRRLLSPDFRYLLSTIEYDGLASTGPPYIIRREELQQLYGEFAEIEKLDGFQTTRFKDMDVKEVVYLLTPRRA